MFPPTLYLRLEYIDTQKSWDSCFWIKKFEETYLDGGLRQIRPKQWDINTTE